MGGVGGNSNNSNNIAGGGGNDSSSMAALRAQVAKMEAEAQRLRDDNLAKEAALKATTAKVAAQEEAIDDLNMSAMMVKRSSSFVRSIVFGRLSVRTYDGSFGRFLWLLGQWLVYDGSFSRVLVCTSVHIFVGHRAINLFML
jgi:hypothetical protein